MKNGKGIIDDFISVLPFEMHLIDYGDEGLRKYSACGPGTKLNERSSGPPYYIPKDWSKPINDLDKGAYYHDICYDKYKDRESRKICDAELYKVADSFQPKSLTDKINKKIVTTVMGKMKGGNGLKKKSLYKK